MRHYFIKGIPIAFLVSTIALLSSFAGCQASTEVLPSPPGYDLNRPSVVKLPAYLEEISGVAFYSKDRSIFAICDEKAVLYKIYPRGNKAIQKWKFGKDADFEDLVLIDSVFYALKSNGIIISLRIVSPDSFVIKEHIPPISKKNEFEILYHDKQGNQLIMLCKDCEADDKNSLSSLAFDLKSLNFSSRAAYVIDVRKIEELMQEKKVKFKPSAAAIHPKTGQLYIISSVNKVLVVADQNGIPEKVYRINPGLYKQPEGLTFTPEGNLIISNESADIGAANILVFKYTNKG